LEQRVRIDTIEKEIRIAFSGWPLSQAERTAILKWADDATFDVEFREWLREVIITLETVRYEVREIVSVGLDQLVEIVDDPSRVIFDIDGRSVSWTGPVSVEQRNVIEGIKDDERYPGWVNVSPFTGTFRDLLAEFQKTYTFTFDRSEVTPTVADPFSKRIVIDKTPTPATIVWTARYLSDDELKTLNTWKDEASFGPTFREAVADLLKELLNGKVTTAIREADWNLRPEAPDFAQVNLAETVMLARSPVQFRGLMKNSERELLKKACKQTIDKQVMHKLFDDALQGGFEGARLEIRALKGSAEPQKAPVRSQL
jgi:hypothetical protein